VTLLCVWDDCTEADESLAEQERSVERTIAWARRCKDHFVEKTKGSKTRPLIFGIVQGGNNRKLRKKCAEALIALGLMVCIWGWPVDRSGKFLSGIVKYTASVMPDNLPKYAMGVGKPEDIMKCVKMGYNMFDCVLPTRDAATKDFIHSQVKTLPKQVHSNSCILAAVSMRTIQKPVSDICTCTTCKNYSRGYLNHLFKRQDSLAIRLATIHNLRFYSELMEKISKLK
jgi:queuine tRNA-ribosyltransferase